MYSCWLHCDNKNCCKDCPDRSATCHATCKRYLAQRAEREAAKQIEVSQKDADAFRAASVRAFKVKSGLTPRTF